MRAAPVPVLLMPSTDAGRKAKPRHTAMRALRRQSSQTLARRLAAGSWLRGAVRALSSSPRAGAGSQRARAGMAADLPLPASRTAPRASAPSNVPREARAAIRLVTQSLHHCRQASDLQTLADALENAVRAEAALPRYVESFVAFRMVLVLLSDPTGTALEPALAIFAAQQWQPDLARRIATTLLRYAAHHAPTRFVDVAAILLEATAVDPLLQADVWISGVGDCVRSGNERAAIELLRCVDPAALLMARPEIGRWEIALHMLAVQVATRPTPSHHQQYTSEGHTGSSSEGMLSGAVRSSLDDASPSPSTAVFRAADRPSELARALAEFYRGYVQHLLQHSKTRPRREVESTLAWALRAESVLRIPIVAEDRDRLSARALAGFVGRRSSTTASASGAASARHGSESSVADMARDTSETQAALLAQARWAGSANRRASLAPELREAFSLGPATLTGSADSAIRESLRGGACSDPLAVIRLIRPASVDMAAAAFSEALEVANTSVIGWFTRALQLRFERSDIHRALIMEQTHAVARAEREVASGSLVVTPVSSAVYLPSNTTAGPVPASRLSPLVASAAELPSHAVSRTPEEAFPVDTIERAALQTLHRTADRIARRPGPSSAAAELVETSRSLMQQGVPVPRETLHLALVAAFRRGAAEEASFAIAERALSSLMRDLNAELGTHAPASAAEVLVAGPGALLGERLVPFHEHLDMLVRAALEALCPLGASGIFEGQCAARDEAARHASAQGLSVPPPAPSAPLLAAEAVLGTPEAASAATGTSSTTAAAAAASTGSGRRLPVVYGESLVSGLPIFDLTAPGGRPLQRRAVMAILHFLRLTTSRHAKLPPQRQSDLAWAACCVLWRAGTLPSAREHTYGSRLEMEDVLQNLAAHVQSGRLRSPGRQALAGAVAGLLAFGDAAGALPLLQLAVTTNVSLDSAFWQATATVAAQRDQLAVLTELLEAGGNLLWREPSVRAAIDRQAAAASASQARALMSAEAHLSRPRLSVPLPRSSSVPQQPDPDSGLSLFASDHSSARGSSSAVSSMAALEPAPAREDVRVSHSHFAELGPAAALAVAAGIPHQASTPTTPHIYAVLGLPSPADADHVRPSILPFSWAAVVDDAWARYFTPEELEQLAEAAEGKDRARAARSLRRAAAIRSRVEATSERAVIESLDSTRDAHHLSDSNLASESGVDSSPMARIDSDEGEMELFESALSELLMATTPSSTRDRSRCRPDSSLVPVVEARKQEGPLKVIVAPEETPRARELSGAQPRPSPVRRPETLVAERPPPPAPVVLAVPTVVEPPKAKPREVIVQSTPAVEPPESPQRPGSERASLQVAAQPERQRTRPGPSELPAQLVEASEPSQPLLQPSLPAMATPRVVLRSIARPIPTDEAAGPRIEVLESSADLVTSGQPLAGLLAIPSVSSAPASSNLASSAASPSSTVPSQVRTPLVISRRGPLTPPVSPTLQAASMIDPPPPLPSLVARAWSSPAPTPVPRVVVSRPSPKSQLLESHPLPAVASPLTVVEPLQLQLSKPQTRSTRTRDEPVMEHSDTATLPFAAQDGESPPLPSPIAPQRVVVGAPSRLPDLDGSRAVSSSSSDRQALDAVGRPRRDAESDEYDGHNRFLGDGALHASSDSLLGSSSSLSSSAAAGSEQVATAAAKLASADFFGLPRATAIATLRAHLLDQIQQLNAIQPPMAQAGRVTPADRALIAHVGRVTLPDDTLLAARVDRILRPPHSRRSSSSASRNRVPSPAAIAKKPNLNSERV